MSNVDDDLRATSEDLHADARRLEEIEEEKGRLAPDDPRMVELSAEAEELTRRMAVKAKAESRLADDASGEARP